MAFRNIYKTGVLKDFSASKTADFTIFFHTFGEMGHSSLEGFFLTKMGPLPKDFL